MSFKAQPLPKVHLLKLYKSSWNSNSNRATSQGIVEGVHELAFVAFGDFFFWSF
jgi:hypothetical protein